MHIRTTRCYVRLAIISTAFSLWMCPAAEATNKVSSPDVTQGRTEFEYRGGYDWDETASKDHIDQHKFVANYGITDRWRIEVKTDLASNGTERDWTFFELANRFQINKDDSVWPKLSVQANYKFSLQDNTADRLGGTVLASKDTGPFTHVTNLNFENELGPHAHAGTDFNLGWKTKYRYQPSLEPGVEFYADFGKVIGPVPAGAKKYSLGPVLYGALTPRVKYEIGLLAGISAAAPDARLKTIITYGF